LSVDEISFLKRHFVYREDLGRWVAPLEMSSIGKSLAWFIPSTAVQEEEQILSTLVSALWELFFHLDEESYEMVRYEAILYYSSLYNIRDTDINRLFPTFQFLREHLEEN
jgi:hypothetical protein